LQRFIFSEKKAWLKADINGRQELKQRLIRGKNRNGINLVWFKSELLAPYGASIQIYDLLMYSSILALVTTPAVLTA
jgi:hypothetical protein